MQVFLPYPDFESTAKCLDNKRLGNQCYRECKTLLNGGWEYHPCSKMWKGYEWTLCGYAYILAVEMQRRNEQAIENNFKPPWKTIVPTRWQAYYREVQDKYPYNGLPVFLGNEKFHAAHRSNLLRKDPEWYGQFGWKEPDDLTYEWIYNETNY